MSLKYYAVQLDTTANYNQNDCNKRCLINAVLILSVKIGQHQFNNQIFDGARELDSILLDIGTSLYYASIHDVAV